MPKEKEQPIKLSEKELARIEALKGVFVSRRPVYKAVAGEPKPNGGIYKNSKFNLPDNVDLYEVFGVYYIYEGSDLVYIGKGTDQNGVFKTIARHFQNWNDYFYEPGSGVKVPVNRVTNFNNSTEYAVQTFPNTEKGKQAAENFERLEIVANTPKYNLEYNPQAITNYETVTESVEPIADAIESGTITEEAEILLDASNDTAKEVVAEVLDKNQEDRSKAQAEEVREKEEQAYSRSALFRSAADDIFLGEPPF